MPSQLCLEHVLKDRADDQFRPIQRPYQGVEGERPTHRWRSVVERYLDHQLGLYIALRERRHVEVPKDLCAPEYGVAAYWPTRGFFQNLVPDAPRDLWELKLVAVEQRARKMQRAVLVTVRQFLEMPQGAVPALPCAAFRYRKRLHGHDHLDQGPVNALQELAPSLIVEIDALQKDGELKPQLLGLGPGRQVQVLHADTPRVAPSVQQLDEMVQRGSDIVDDLADLDAPHERWRMPDFDADDQLASLRPEIYRGSIRILGKVCVEFIPERLKLGPCPF